MPGLGDQQLAIGSLEEVVRVPARQEPRRGRGTCGIAEARLVAGQDPCTVQAVGAWAPAQRISTVPVVDA